MTQHGASIKLVQRTYKKQNTDLVMYSTLQQRNTRLFQSNTLLASNPTDLSHRLSPANHQRQTTRQRSV
eukprot:8786-Heterococcus_DN1.PRE.2